MFAVVNVAVVSSTVVQVAGSDLAVMNMAKWQVVSLTVALWHDDFEPVVIAV